MSPLTPYTQAMETYSILITSMESYGNELRSDALLLMDGEPYKGYKSLRLVILWGSNNYTLCGTDKRGGLLEVLRTGSLPFGNGTELVKDIMFYIDRHPTGYSAEGKSSAFIAGWDAYNLMVPIMNSPIIGPMWHEWLKGWTSASKSLHRKLEERGNGEWV